MDTITAEGVFTRQTKTIITDNFDEVAEDIAALQASTAGGTLTSAHLLVGNSSNVATDRAITGDVAITNGGVTSIASGITTAKLPSGVAAGYVLARGTIALDGSNPTPITTGLTTVTGFAATLQGSSAPGLGTSVLTHTISSGTVSVYAWKVTGSGDCTLIASTGTETISWVAVGT